MESYLITLEPRIRLIEKQNVKKSYFQSDHFYDLNLESLKAALKTSNALKHRLISQIFQNSIIEKNEIETDIWRIFLNIINEFSTHHFEIFKYLISIQNEHNIDSYESIYREFCDSEKVSHLDLYQFRLYCRELKYKSLVRFSSNIIEIQSSGGLFETEDSKTIPSIILTSLGEKFLKLFRE